MHEHTAGGVLLEPVGLFTLQSLCLWISRRHPRADHDRVGLDSTFQGMINNASGGLPSAWRVE